MDRLLNRTVAALKKGSGAIPMKYIGTYCFITTYQGSVIKSEALRRGNPNRFFRTVGWCQGVSCPDIRVYRATQADTTSDRLPQRRPRRCRRIHKRGMRRQDRDTPILHRIETLDEHCFIRPHAPQVSFLSRSSRHIFRLPMTSRNSRI